MIEILVATNRLKSNSERLAHLVQKKLSKKNLESQIMTLATVNWADLEKGLYGADHVPASMRALIDRVNQAEGLYVICPEYNGSYPGVVKTFIDYWDYPASFEKRPVCFTGLGGMFGGLRPVEHLQQVFGYRNSFMFPERLFLQNVWALLDEKGQISDETLNGLLDQQLEGFVKFIGALKQSGLHCLGS